MQTQSQTHPMLFPAGELAGRPGIALALPVVLAGSRHTANIRISSSKLSKAHALFVRDEGRVFVRDLNSRAGVTVNGASVREAELRGGELVGLGPFHFEFAAGEPLPALGEPRTLAPAFLDVEGGPPVPLRDEHSYAHLPRILLIGKRAGSDLSLEDESVSTAHAAVFEIDGRRYIRDLGSRGGTLVNGQPVAGIELRFGDVIQVGAVTMRYMPADAMATAASVGVEPGVTAVSVVDLEPAGSAITPEPPPVHATAPLAPPDEPPPAAPQPQAPMAPPVMAAEASPEMPAVDFEFLDTPSGAAPGPGAQGDKPADSNPTAEPAPTPVRLVRPVPQPSPFESQTDEAALLSDGELEAQLGMNVELPADPRTPTAAPSVPQPPHRETDSIPRERAALHARQTTRAPMPDLDEVVCFEVWAPGLQVAAEPANAAGRVSRRSRRRRSLRWAIAGLLGLCLLAGGAFAAVHYGIIPRPSWLPGRAATGSGAQTLPGPSWRATSWVAGTISAWPTRFCATLATLTV